MKKEMKRLTTAQFAKLHEVNKRTLHYYDDIGLFCPLTKEENGYRYYDISQSIDFEYIRMLKILPQFCIQYTHLLVMYVVPYF